MLTSHVRDTRGVERPEGAAVAWTRMGEGNIGIATMSGSSSRSVPGGALSLEIIVTGPALLQLSRSQVLGRYRTTPAWEFARFLSLVEKGSPQPAPPRLSQEAAVAKEREDLEASIKWTQAFLASI